MAVNDSITMIESSESTSLPFDAMIPSRCESAPPYFEESSSFSAIRNPSVKNFNNGMLDNSAEEMLLTDPKYISYYNANVNLNPRLPPPLISRESRHFVGMSYAKKLISSDDNNQDLNIKMGLLSTQEEEDVENALTQQQILDEIVDVDNAASLSGPSKSFADLLQGLEDQTRASGINDPPSTSSQLGNNNSNIVGTTLTPLNISSASVSQHDQQKHENMLLCETYGLPFYPPNNTIQQMQRLQVPRPYMPQGIYGPFNKPFVLNQGYVMNVGNQFGPRGTQFGMGGYPHPSSFYNPYLGGNLPQNMISLPFDPYARINLLNRVATAVQAPFYSPLQGQHFQHSFMDQNVRHAAQRNQYESFLAQKDSNLAAFMYHEHRNLSSGSSSSSGAHVPGFNPMLQLPMNGRNHLEKTDIYAEQKGQRGSYTMEDPKRHTYLQTLRFGGGANLELSDISENIVELSTDQHGSRFIQQKLETSTVQEKEYVFTELLPHASRLMIDVFGNYVIQKLFEHGTSEHRRQLADQFTGQMLKLSLQMYGCRVIQKALEVIEVDQKAALAKELDGHVVICVHDQNGNHVIQKCIERIPTEKIGFIISAFHGAVATLSVHPYGCRVIQRSLEHCSDTSDTRFIIDEILDSASLLAHDQYGNYVIQHILQFGKPQERSQVMSKLAGKFVEMSQHKYASNVIEKCLVYGDASGKESLIREIVGRSQEKANLLIMMKDQYANYVIQRILDICNEEEKNILMNCLGQNLESLKKYTYGKHIVIRYEQLLSGNQEQRAG